MTRILVCRAVQRPLSLRLDELSVYYLQRLATVLVAAKLAASDVGCGALAADAAVAAEALGDIVLENLCPVALRVRQVGGGGVCSLASRATRCVGTRCGWQPAARTAAYMVPARRLA